MDKGRDRKGKKVEENVETSDDSIGRYDSFLSSSSSAYTYFSKNDINSDSSLLRDFTLIVPRRKFGKSWNN